MRMKFGRIGRIPRKIRAAWLAFLNPDLIAETDPTTGALTRRRFEQIAQRELARAKRGEKFSLILIDLDNLKKINDTEGHAAGDRYLKDFAQTVLGKIRSYDLFARWGGDEFLLLISGGSREALTIIERIYNLFPRFSWGISTWREGDDLKSLVERADGEMYKMKKKHN